MIEHEVAKAYSQALYELAVEEDKVVEYLEKLAEFKDIINDSQELRDFLFNPRIKTEDKKKLLNKIFGGDLPQLLYNFLFLLFDKRREDFFEAIFKEYRKMVNKRKNIMEIEVISAIPLPGEYRNKLKSKLKDLLAYEIILKMREDPDIMGGLILKADDYIIDGSIKNRLSLLTEKIKNIPVSKLGV